MMIRIAICDDHGVVREGLKNILAEVGDIEVSAEATNGHEALEIARKLQCDVMLLDINMPGQNGIEVLRVIKQGQPTFPVLMLSGCSGTQYAMPALKIGADGYLDKYCSPEEMIRAIRLVAAGRRYLNVDAGDLLAKSLLPDSSVAAHAKLSDREFQVFLRLSKGETVSDMAASLCLSVKTVSTYRSRVMEKMGTHSNSELTYYAMKNGLLD